MRTRERVMRNHTEIDPQRLYSSSEVAVFIGKHPRTVRRYINAGKFPNAQRLGHRQDFFVPGSDVIAFLEEEE